MRPRLPVSYLFVPGDRPDRFAKAVAAGAGAVVVDLEDAVAPNAKAAARAHIGEWCKANPAPSAGLIVRINDAATSWFDDDLAFVRAYAIAAVMLPKAERAQDIARCIDALPAEGFVIAIIETARGVVEIDVVASAPGVQRLAFGTLDYAVDVGLSGDERGLLYPASRMALASRIAGIASPIAGVTAALDDPARLDADLAFARACGFGAKLCIHPRQLEHTHRAFAPTAEEIDWARRVVAAVDAGHAAVAIDGKMVDRPVLLKARDILDRA